MTDPARTQFERMPATDEFEEVLALGHEVPTLGLLAPDAGPP